jgi:hypothetical protein
VKSTLESKVGFESFAKRFNVSIKHIHSDNGVFATKVFQDHIDASDQHQSFCGVGAHWQNGVIERYIGVITTRAHTMLLHAMERWPDVITSEMWSFAFMHAVHLHNCTPRPGQTKSPYTLFTDEDPPALLQDYQVFGSPIYVLDSTLQSGNLGPGKWKNRCHQGIYIGHSPHHASNVILVYNPKTRLVSPQYHVVHDENFDMVQISKSKAEAEADLEKMLDELFISARWQHTDAYTDNDSTVARHYYFDNSWDLAYQQAQADCQRDHEDRQANGSSRKRTRDSSTPSPVMPSSEGAPRQASRAQVPAIDSPPSGRSGHSNLSAPLSTASEHEGAAFSDALPETSTRRIIPDPPDSYERTSDDTAELATQRHQDEIEASPILVPARTPLGDDLASPDADDIIHIVSQLGSIGSPAK